MREGGKSFAVERAGARKIEVMASKPRNNARETPVVNSKKVAVATVVMGWGVAMLDDVNRSNKKKGPK